MRSVGIDNPQVTRINEGDESSYESDFEGDLIIIDEASMIDAYLFTEH